MKHEHDIWDHKILIIETEITLCCLISFSPQKIFMAEYDSFSNRIKCKRINIFEVYFYCQYLKSSKIEDLDDFEVDLSSKWWPKYISSNTQVKIKVRMCSFRGSQVSHSRIQSLIKKYRDKRLQ